MGSLYHQHSRRKFIGAALVGIASAATTSPVSARRINREFTSDLPPDAWEEMVPFILNRIKRPVFPDRSFVVTSFGAVGDGKTDCRPAMEEAIRQCNSLGGGRIVLPSGTWIMRGPIHLKSNVHIFVEEGAVMRFDPDPEFYLPLVLTRWEGTELFNYSPMVYAYQATNVAITGKGTIDGNTKETFATWKPRQKTDQKLLRRMGGEGVPVYQRIFGKGHWLRPPMIQFFGCRNVLVEGVTIRDSPFWVVHPVYCQNVTIRGVRVDSHNANNDGVDPDSCVDVLIEDCHFDTGDDSVAIKSGRDEDGWRVGQATENVIVRNCEMNSLANGLCVGSEMSGGVRNIFMENCRMGNVDSAIYFKANLDRGGRVEHVHVRDIHVKKAKTLINFTTAYHSYRGGSHPPVFGDFSISEITCAHAEIAIDAMGVAQEPLRDISLTNISVRQAAVVKRIEHAENLMLDNVRVNGVVVATD